MDEVPGTPDPMEPFLDKVPLPLPLLPDTYIYGNSGPFDWNIGLFCENIGLFCKIAGVFWRGSALLQQSRELFLDKLPLLPAR